MEKNKGFAIRREKRFLHEKLWPDSELCQAKSKTNKRIKHEIHYPKKEYLCRCISLICFVGVVYFAWNSSLAENTIEFNKGHSSEGKIDQDEKTIAFEKLVSHQDNGKIVPTPNNPTKSQTEKRREFERPEDGGEHFSLLITEELLNKLKKGDSIEQRKAANELWARFGTSQSNLSETEKEMISKSVERYLANIKNDFEENFMQVQRLWHLAVPALLKNVTVQDVSVSENAARLLSVMKTPQIIDRLIIESNKAEAQSEIEKYIFALEYMKINNRYFLDNRSRMSDSECDAYYMEQVSGQVNLLKQKLLKRNGSQNQ